MTSLRSLDRLPSIFCLHVPVMIRLIYCYKYYWAGNQKAQSAWFKWTFDYYIKAIAVIDNYLYLIGDTGSAYHTGEDKP